MIEIRKVNISQAKLLADLSRITYVESHGHFIEDKNDLKNYIDKAFSITKIEQELLNDNGLFYVAYYEDTPVGYVKMELYAKHEEIESKNICRLERIYVLSDFLHLKIGQKLIDFVEKKAQTLMIDTMWLTVYIENQRAIRFYQKNGFQEVGSYNFMVNKTNYVNTVFAKQI